MEWILTTERMPAHGQMVVKYWNANGNVWAGRHIADAKHGSFDKWIPLPSNALGKRRAATGLKGIDEDGTTASV